MLARGECWHEPTRVDGCMHGSGLLSSRSHVRVRVRALGGCLELKEGVATQAGDIPSAMLEPTTPGPTFGIASAERACEELDAHERPH